MKPDLVYNNADNKVFVSSLGDKIIVVCDTDRKLEQIQQRFHEAGNTITDFEVWDEGEDKKYIVTFNVTNDPVLN